MRECPHDEGSSSDRRGPRRTHVLPTARAALANALHAVRENRDPVVENLGETTAHGYRLGTIDLPALDDVVGEPHEQRAVSREYHDLAADLVPTLSPTQHDRREVVRRESKTRRRDDLQ